MLEEGVLVTIDDGCCIRQNSLDLGLLGAVQSWSTEEFKCGCVVPIDIRSNPIGIAHDPRVIIGAINLALGARKVFAAIVAVQPCPNFVLRPNPTSGSGWYVGTSRCDLVRRILAGEVRWLGCGGRGCRVLAYGASYNQGQ